MTSVELAELPVVMLYVVPLPLLYCPSVHSAWAHGCVLLLRASEVVAEAACVGRASRPCRRRAAAAHACMLRGAGAPASPSRPFGYLLWPRLYAQPTWPAHMPSPHAHRPVVRAWWVGAGGLVGRELQPQPCCEVELGGQQRPVEQRNARDRGQRADLAEGCCMEWWGGLGGGNRPVS